MPKKHRVTLQRPVAVVLIGALLLSSTACTSMRPVRVAKPNDPTYEEVKPGDTVMVETAGRERWRFVVEQIDGDAIVARGGTRFPRKNIVRLWRRSFSGPKTAGLIAGIVGGVYVMLGAATAAALDGLWREPPGSY